MKPISRGVESSEGNRSRVQNLDLTVSGATDKPLINKVYAAAKGLGYFFFE
jgi:hypothetical protein